jgi:hypothetical protein
MSGARTPFSFEPNVLLKTIVLRSKKSFSARDPKTGRLAPPIDSRLESRMLTVEQLLGRLTDEDEVKAFFAAHGLVPDLVDDSTTAQGIPSGIEVRLYTPWSVKLPQYLTLEKKPRKRPYRRAVVSVVTLFAEDVLCWHKTGPARQEPAKAFAGPLPLDLAWTDSPTALLDRFGKPDYSSVDKDTGAFTWLRWNLPDQARYLMINAEPSGKLTHIVWGMLVEE